MAARNPKPGTDNADVIDQLQSLLQDETYDAESLNPALATLYAELQVGDDGEATVHISKLSADGRGTEANVWKGDPEQYDLERIAKTFGSGDYRVKVYVRIPTGQKVLKGNKVFSWLLSPDDEAKRTAPKADANPGNGLSALDIGRLIADGIKAAMPQAPAVAPVDPLQQIKQLAEVMAMLRPEAPQQTQQLGQLDQLKSMVEIVSMLKGDPDDGPRGVNANGTDLLMNVINKFGPLLMQALPAIQAGAVQQQMAQLPMEPQPMATPAPMVTQPQQTQESEEMLKLKMGLQFLMMQCEAGNDPLTYANVVLDNVPEESIQALLSNPQPLDWLGQFIPNIKNPPYADWFTKLLAECREMTTEEDADADATAPTLPGNIPPGP